MIGIRSRWAAISLTVLTAMSCGRAGSQIQNVFGEDNRERVNTRDYPFSALGKLDNSCTGVLIGKRLMLTAAHCVFDSATQKPRDNFTRFDLGLLNGQVSASSQPIRAWIGSVQPEETRSTDWAIVELADELGVSSKVMSVSAIDFAKTLPYAVNLAGYNSDVNAGLTASVHWGCAIHKVVDSKLFHDCDSTAGISGGPLFASIDGDWRIVGVSVSEFRNGIEPPVKRDSWSSEYTNVAVSGHEFIPVAQKLLESVDQKRIAPDLNDAIVIDFKSRSTVVGPKPEREQEPAHKPDNAPHQQPGPQPGQQPELLQTPIAQSSPDILYAASQMQQPWILWQRISHIQNSLRALSVDSSVMLSAASTVGDLYSLAVVNHFHVKLSENIYAWNAFVHCMSTCSPCRFDTQVLYNSYVGMKYAEVDLRHALAQMPVSLTVNLMAQENITLKHLREFEVSVFSP